VLDWTKCLVLLASIAMATAEAPASTSVPCWEARRGPSGKRFIYLDDYPLAAMRHSWQGDVSISFTIGTDGRPKDCTVTQSSGHEVLDTATCAVVNRRACYKPAMKDGVAIESPGTFHFRWRLS